MAINIFTVQSDLESAGWQLLSTTYKNLKTPLEMVCPKGHIIQAKLAAKASKRNKLPQKNNNVYRILALDAATGTTGYSIYDDKQLIAYGTFTTQYSDDSTDKINQVKKWVDEVCQVCAPDAIGIENIQYQKNTV